MQSVKWGILMKNSKVKVIAYLGMLALLASMIVGLMGYSTSTKDIEAVKNSLLKSYLENNIRLSMKYINNSYGKLTAGKGTLLDSQGNSIEGRFGVVDSVLEDMGNESTIFVKENDDFRRISTNVMAGADRAVGTTLGKDHKAYQTVMKGNLYVGEAKILGENYYTAYDPIKDDNNNVIGMLFVGVPTKSLDTMINVHDDTMSSINILIIILRAVSFGALIALVAMSVGSPKKETRQNEPADHLAESME